MKKNFLIIISLSLITFVFLIPFQVKALNVYFDKSVSSINLGDVTLIKVFIDTEGKEINTLEGIVKIEGKADVSSINTGGSVFNLWPEKPRLLNNQEISFTGGTEGGVYGENLRLINFIIIPKVVGEISLQTKGINAYLNDGLGTKLVGDNTDFRIKVAEPNKDDPTSSLEEDNVPPDIFKIELGHDEFLFNGKYFITFNAIDFISGINKYQVKEGNLPYVDSENTYVLKDQTLKSKILVKAIDNALNERIETLNLKDGLSLFEILRDILIAVLIFTVVNILRIFLKGKNK